MDRFAVLVFPRQEITDEQQIAFSRNFGELEETAGGNVTKAGGTAAQPADGRRLQSRPGRQAAGARRPAPDVQSRQPALAFRQLVPRHPGQILASCPAASSPATAATPNSPTCAPPTTRWTTETKARSRGPGLRAFADVFARRARLRRAEPGRARDVQAGAPAPGAHPSGDRPQDRCTCRRTPAPSSAGRCRRRAPSCAT